MDTPTPTDQPRWSTQLYEPDDPANYPDRAEVSDEPGEDAEGNEPRFEGESAERHIPGPFDSEVDDDGA